MKLILVQSVPHSGTSMVVELLRMHPEIEFPLDLIWPKDFPHVQPFLSQGLPLPAQEFATTIFDHCKPNKYCLFWTHMDLRIDIMSSFSDYCFVAPIRHPYSVMRSHILRGDNYKSVPGAYLELMRIIKCRKESFLIQIDANESPEERLARIKTGFNDYLNLELTDLMRKRIAEWIPIGAGKYSRDLTASERKEIRYLLEKFRLLELLREMGFYYELDVR